MKRVVLILFAALSSLHGQTLTDAQLSKIDFDQKVGAKLPPNLWFHDEDGKDVKLGDYFGNKPVILVLGYYKCPMLCNATINGMVEALNDIKWSIGKEFEVVHVSIDPSEAPQLAHAKKQTYLKRYGRVGSAGDWHFLTGEQQSIQTLAEETGFRYVYDSQYKQYAHPGGLIVLTPKGRISQYFAGVTYSPERLFTALKDASHEQSGSRIKELFLLCFSHSPTRGKYGTTILFAARTLGVGTCVGLTCLIAVLARRERRQTKEPVA